MFIGSLEKRCKSPTAAKSVTAMDPASGESDRASCFVNVYKSVRSRENLDSILRVPFKLNKHQSYNAACRLVERAHASAAGC